MKARLVNPDLELQAYVIGLAIGDGNLSNPNGRATRLRITCDTKYPALIAKIRSALQRLLPSNRVSVVRGKGNYVNVSVYSNALEPLLGWRAAGGSKRSQGVRVPEWICQNSAFSVHCLRGLIETDGAVYRDRGYPMVIFSTAILELGKQTDQMIRDLGFKCRFYAARRSLEELPYKYQVRLSRDVPSFLDLVRPLKAQRTRAVFVALFRRAAHGSLTHCQA
jgi:hypothetical protein